MLINFLHRDNVAHVGLLVPLELLKVNSLENLASLSLSVNKTL